MSDAGLRQQSGIVPFYFSQDKRVMHGAGGLALVGVRHRQLIISVHALS
jgi:hypothetical protein